VTEPSLEFIGRRLEAIQSEQRYLRSEQRSMIAEINSLRSSITLLSDQIEATDKKVNELINQNIGMSAKMDVIIEMLKK
jgi:chromosome segregation ATPase